MGRQIPNIITWCRIVASIALLWFKPYTMPFYIIYTITGISDVLDGCIARAFHLESKFGAKLDTVADFLFYFVTFIKILPMLIIKLSIIAWIYLAIIFTIRLFSYSYASLKFHQLASLHTYLNKLTGLCVFLIPYFIQKNFFGLYSYIGCTVAFLATIEEFIMHIMAKTYDERNKSIFIFLKNCDRV